MKFDNRMKTIANLSWFVCFTAYFVTATVHSLGVHQYPFLVG